MYVFIFGHLQIISQETHTPKATKLLKINHSYSQEGFCIQFNEVISDSRCPRKVHCVWAGSIEVEVEIENYLTKESVLKKVKLDAPNNHDLELIKLGKNKSLYLKNLKPYPQKSNNEIKNEDYQLVFYEAYTKT